MGDTNDAAAKEKRWRDATIGFTIRRKSTSAGGASSNTSAVAKPVEPEPQRDLARTLRLIARYMSMTQLVHVLPKVVAKPPTAWRLALDAASLWDTELLMGALQVSNKSLLISFLLISFLLTQAECCTVVTLRGLPS